MGADQLRRALQRAQGRMDAEHRVATTTWCAPLSLFDEAAQRHAATGGIPDWAILTVLKARRLVEQAAGLGDLTDVYEEKGRMSGAAIQTVGGVITVLAYLQYAIGGEKAVVRRSMDTYLAGSSDAFNLAGKFCLVLYEGERRWHERLLIHQVRANQDSRTSGWFVIATPDGDVYAESLAPPNVLGMVVLDDGRALPPGLARRNVYRFEDGVVGQAPGAGQMAHLRGTAAPELQAVQLEFDSLVAPAGPAAPVAVAPAAPVQPASLEPAAGHSWVVATSDGARVRGSLVPLQQVVSGHQTAHKGVAALTDGSVVFVELVANQDVATYAKPASPTQLAPQALAPVVAQPSQADDARTLAVRYNAEGQRRREFREAVEKSTESAWTDWPVRGPRTAKWVGQYIANNGGSTFAMHNAWRSNSRLQPSDSGVLEHESICKALELALEYDQLNLGELACVELLCRRLQMLQYRRRERVLGSAASGTLDDESHYFLGTDPTRGNLCVCPALNSWLGEELHKEHLANKEQRKAREERALVRTGKNKLPEAETGIFNPNICRATRQRIKRRQAADAWMHEGVCTINELYGRPTSGIGAPVGAHAEVLTRLERQYRRVGAPELHPEEALTALLGTMTTYSDDRMVCKAVFCEDLVSWPEPGCLPVEIADLLEPAVGNLLKPQGIEELLAEEREMSPSEPLKPYVDSVLAHSPKHMGRFLSRLAESKMLDFVPGTRAHTVGVFFVHKKNGKLRLILDTRAANQFFKPPRHSNLPTPSAWCSIEVEEGEKLHTATGDVADAFHRMQLPKHLRQYFRLPAIQCKYLAKSSWPLGCKAQDYVTPEYATLPMGWCWSLFFCQELLQTAALRAGLRQEDRIEDRCWVGPVSEGRVLHAQYVDNFFVSSGDPALTQKYFDKMKTILEEWGFGIHEVTGAQTVVEGLGLVIDGEASQISLTPRRIWKLRLAALALQRRQGAPSPKIVEKVLGHFTFAMLLRRETLSIFKFVYQYCHRDRPDKILWKYALKEILQASSLLPLMTANLSMPWDATLTATDSSEVGYGVCERTADPAAVAGTARCSEAWRFSVEGCIKARESALGLDESGDGLPDLLQHECARTCERDFREVHPNLLDASEWHIVFSGAWDFTENILRTEGRALVSGIRHKLRCRRSLGKRHVCLVDNLALALAVTKGRGRSQLSNRTCQELCALALAADCKFTTRWVPSERNCADKPSRFPRLCPLKDFELACGCARGSVTCASRPGELPSDGHGLRDPGAEPAWVVATADYSTGRQAKPADAPFSCRHRADRYAAVLQTFMQWSRAHQDMSSSWDALLTAYINELYAEGANVSAAEYVFAAFRHHFPSHGKHGGNPMPRSIQALEGYRLLAPPQMRLPTPRIAFVAVVGWFLVKMMVAMAVALLLQWDLLLRPGELIGMSPSQLVPPTDLASMRRWGVVLAPSTLGEASKTNVFDDSVLLSHDLEFLLPALGALLKTRAGAVNLFPFTCAQLAAEFKKGAAALGLDHLGLTLYGNRHGGASEMRLKGMPLSEIKRRGRWATDTSLRRYEKATLAQQQVHKVPGATQLYGSFVESRLRSATHLMSAALSQTGDGALTALSNHFLPLP
ncbi:unnamed protein product, partial [Symbiodinium natans]